jgi:hypothetical protein
MTVEEQEFVEQREAMLTDVLAYVESHQDEGIYQSDVIRDLGGKFSESMIISAVWRLLEMHRIDLNRKLALVVAADS